MNPEEQYKRAFNALLLEVDSSIVENLREISDNYARACCKDILRKAANNAKVLDETWQGKSVIDKKSIIETPVILL